MFQHMLIPTDGSVMSRKAVEAGIALSKRCGCDFIFMASHGRKGEPAAILGSVARKVVQLAHVPVAVFRTA